MPSCGGACRLIYSTRSATPDDRRWRVLLPLAEPLAGADYADTQNALFDLLAERGIETDRSLARPGQLVYLPNRGEHYEHRVEQRRAAEADDRSPDHPAARGDPPGSRRRGQEAARAEAQARARARGAGRTGATRRVVDRSSTRGSTVAGAAGALRLRATAAATTGGQPFQSSGSYATRDYGDYWVSLSGSDAAAGLGAASANGHRFGDAFDLFVHFEHAGDFEPRSALTAGLEPGAGPRASRRAGSSGRARSGCMSRRRAERGGQDAAEETADPLDGLVEKSAEDPGAAFTPEVLERLATLKKEDRAAFEALRARLKKAGCRVTALDEAMAEDAGDGGRGPTQADILIDLAGAAELFHSSDGTAFADVMINEHRETWPVRTKGFRRWLARQFFEQTGGAPSSEALQSALNVIEAKAHFDGPERPVFIRVGGLDGRLYLDLGGRGLAGGGNRRRRLAGNRQSARALPARGRHAAPGLPDARRIGGDAARLPERPVR